MMVFMRACDANNSDIVWDRVEATVGIRDALFDPRRGFVLNGVKVITITSFNLRI